MAGPGTGAACSPRPSTICVRTAARRRSPGSSRQTTRYGASWPRRAGRPTARTARSTWASRSRWSACTPTSPDPPPAMVATSDLPERRARLAVDLPRQPLGIRAGGVRAADLAGHEVPGAGERDVPQVEPDATGRLVRLAHTPAVRQGERIVRDDPGGHGRP